ncbi:HAD-IIB family hydrolase [Curvibacter sp. APW13]|uniref:HAD family hydrolase n=1 Tax=Curvibacter sp. APW13 TaxID=3077236 RepID=UPI0028DE3949|nr:HAD-IIB family hydrolase [Curvibacter sp. APW13]MDT8992961.1 HAD-IIB family hydrolase [Curvibacter sp. APW13]
MKPLSDWPLAERRGIVGVFTDIDDTLTSEGSITPDALQALHDLHAAGVVVIPVTGRPIGWCQRFMDGLSQEPWPVPAMVAENGGVAFVRSLSADVQGQIRPEPAEKLREPLSKLYQLDAATRAANAAAMQQVAQRVLRELPGVGLSRDGGGRETDLAFDYAEYAQLPPETVQQVLAILHESGMETSVSSIHIHGCFGHFDKWTGAQWILRTLMRRELADELDRWVFIGDSGNDQVMFRHFRHSVGVANIARCASSLTDLPRYITPAERGTGFAQMAQAILQAR